MGLKLTCIIYEQIENMAIVKFNRPEVLNAMNRQLWIDFKVALNKASEDSSVKALIITGEGRAFSAGADLKESGTRSLSEYKEYLEELQTISKQLIEFEKPTIAAINGYAIGSGYEIALACDLRVMAEEAQIASPEAKVESSVTGGAFKLLHDLIGPAKAKEILFIGDNISSKEALQLGLVNKVVALEKLMEESKSLASKIAKNSSLSIKLMKKGLAYAAQGMDLDELMEYEVASCLEAVSTKERKEKISEFKNRKS